MKKKYILSVFAVAFSALFFSACSPITMTSWTSPKMDPSFKIKSMVIWAMFDKMEYEKPFELAVSDYLSGKGIKTMPALTILELKKKYTYDELEDIFNKVGANCALIFTYKGKQTTENYVPPTTNGYPNYYYNYYSYYNFAWGGYWGGAAVTSTPGYWTTSTTVNVEANLYTNATDDLVYTASIQYTDPSDIQNVGYDIAKKIYSDWVRIKTASKN
jgi:hypothetical protein